MNLVQSNIKTMNSEELADLLNLRHDNVRQSIKNLESHGIITFTESTVKGSGRPKQVISLDKRCSIIVAAKLNDKFLATVVDRWIYLEAQQAPAIPQTYAAALLEAGRLAGIVDEQQAQIAIAAPKVEYHDNVLASTNGMTTTVIAAQLGMSAQKLNARLKKLMIQKKVDGRWVLRVKYLDRGLTTEETYLDDGGNSRHSMKWTEKGRKFIIDLVKG